MGHTEVVAIDVPKDKVETFLEQRFLQLFDANGIRADPQDTGREYRSALGLADGIRHPAVARLKSLATQKGMRLLEGLGGEGDTLRERSIYVYDTRAFGFYSAELYHQFHNDMVGTYGPQYAALRDAAQARRLISLSSCPGDSSSDTPLESLEKRAKAAYAEWKLQRKGVGGQINLEF